MKHYYVTSPERVEVVEEEIPTPGPGEVLVKLAYTAISPGSNVYVYRTGSYTGKWEGGREEALYMGSGIVEGVGLGVDHLAPGDPVGLVGVGHQEYAALPVDRVGKIPEGLSLRDASVAYLSGWSLSALHLGSYAAGETVVVIGQGLVGASASLMADQMGARVLSLDADPTRVAFARTLETGPVEEPDAPGAAARIAAYLGDDGVDLILETSGSWRGFKQAINLARDWTRIAVMGIYRQPPPGDLALELHQLLYGFPSKFHYKRLQIIGCGYDPDVVTRPNPHLSTRPGNFTYTLERAARGKLPVGRLITHTLPPGEIGSALARFVAGEMSQVGVVFDWT